jgi:hypothetical protein
MDKKDVEDLTEDVVDAAGYEPPDYQLLAQDRKVRGKRTHWATASIKLASRASPHRRARRSTAGSTLPALQKVDLGENAA